MKVHAIFRYDLLQGSEVLKLCKNSWTQVPIQIASSIPTLRYNVGGL